MRSCKKGKYNNEMINYALDLTYLDNSKRLIGRICIITNESILLIKQLKSLSAAIPLRRIRGMMVYYYDHREGARSTVHMELDNGTVVKLHTS